jgi:hypothetical protein
MSNAKINPFAERIRKFGYSTPDGYYSPEDIEEMNCGVESIIPKNIRKRIRQVVSKDVSNTRLGGTSVGALDCLVGHDGAESLYIVNPESYLCELERVENLLEESGKQPEPEETITFTIDELMAIESGDFPQRAREFIERNEKKKRRQAKH